RARQTLGLCCDALEEQVGRARALHGALRALLPGELPPPSRQLVTAVQLAAGTACLGFAGCCFLGLHTGCLAVAAGAVAGVAQLGKEVAARAAPWLNAMNRRAWEDCVARPKFTSPAVPAWSSFAERASQHGSCALPARPPAHGAARALGPGDETRRGGVRAEATAGRSQARRACGAGSAQGRLRRPASRRRGAPLERERCRTMRCGEALRGGGACAAKSPPQKIGTTAVRGLAFGALGRRWVWLDLPWDLWLPDFPLLLTLDVDLWSRGPYLRGARLAIADAVVDRLVEAVRVQVQMWDFRDADPRFRDFCEPLQVSFGIDLQWPSPEQLNVEVSNFATTLHLPA
ncbi:unnamed protein product, partial [Prorocentrum cordatum]